MRDTTKWLVAAVAAVGAVIVAGLQLSNLPNGVLAAVLALIGVAAALLGVALILRRAAAVLSAGYTTFGELTDLDQDTDYIEEQRKARKWDRRIRLLEQRAHSADPARLPTRVAVRVAIFLSRGGRKLSERHAKTEGVRIHDMLVYLNRDAFFFTGGLAVNLQQLYEALESTDKSVLELRGEKAAEDDTARAAAEEVDKASHIRIDALELLSQRLRALVRGVSRRVGETPFDAQVREIHRALESTLAAGQYLLEEAAQANNDMGTDRRDDLEGLRNAVGRAHDAVDMLRYEISQIGEPNTHSYPESRLLESTRYLTRAFSDLFASLARSREAGLQLQVMGLSVADEAREQLETEWADLTSELGLLADAAAARASEVLGQSVEWAHLRTVEGASIEDDQSKDANPAAGAIESADAGGRRSGLKRAEWRQARLETAAAELIAFANQKLLEHRFRRLQRAIFTWGSVIALGVALFAVSPRFAEPEPLSITSPTRVVLTVQHEVLTGDCPVGTTVQGVAVGGTWQRPIVVTDTSGGCPAQQITVEPGQATVLPIVPTAPSSSSPSAPTSTTAPG